MPLRRKIREGMDNKVSDAKRFYFVRIGALISNSQVTWGQCRVSHFSDFFAIFAIFVTTGLTLVIFYQLWKGAA